MRILVVEDDAEMRSLLVSLLRADGYEVVEAGTGTEGVVSIHDSSRLGDSTQNFDLIVSDVRLPGWTGLELLDMVRRRRLKTPVLLITGFGAEEVHVEAARLGVAAIMDKPFRLEDFRATVAALVRP